ncbi:MAG: hypothetical protein ISS59_07795 [Desulfobacteraceae bacterium]|nr:hypothetical protein [Desulfobacteraceae bacterium]
MRIWIPKAKKKQPARIRITWRNHQKTLYIRKILGNRSQVQGSTFRVKDKDGIESPKFSIKMLLFPNNCQFAFNFWIGPDEADVFLVNTHPKCSSETRMEP